VRRPLVHVSGDVPRRVADALRASFELADRPEGVDGILTITTTRVDDAYLDQAGPQLRVVANYGVGVDNIDLATAYARRITVTNTPDVLTDATAELTVGLMLAVLRRINEGDRLIRARGTWEFNLEFMLGESLKDKLVAIVGPGRIGNATARLVSAFGAIAAPVGRNEALEEALAGADIVSLHCPLTPETFHLIGRPQLSVMKQTAFLINAARGPIVDEHALVEALEQGAIAGAALDVFEFEPAVTRELRELENVVLTPHLGSATLATREAMGMVAVQSLREVLLEQRRPATAVALHEAIT
jgi:glyoxylate reductase